MNICFTHAYYRFEDEKEQKITKPSPPLGLLYLSAWPEPQDSDNEVYEPTLSSFLDEQAYLLAQHTNIIAI